MNPLVYDTSVFMSYDTSKQNNELLEEAAQQLASLLVSTFDEIHLNKRVNKYNNDNKIPNLSIIF